MEAAIPEGFKTMLRSLPDIDAEALISALDTPPSVSIKINRRKYKGTLDADSVGEFLGYAALSPVEWCDSGFYLPSRPQFTLNPLLHAGVFYVQDASSLIYESMLRRHTGDMAPGLVLDMCAAPGGKSTSILNALPDGWHLVANEYVPTRAKALRENLLKWGYPQVTVTNNSTDRLSATGPLFSIVAVDAPCSGEGMMRKEETARTQWSPGLVEQCAALQRDILTDAAEALLPGGLLIYSTCTFNPTENDGNLQWLINEYGFEIVEGPHRFMPHITRGEGLYTVLLRKPGILSAPRNAEKRLAKMLSRCRVLSSPDSPDENTAPLRTDFDINKYPLAEVNKETALDYLRRNAIVLDPDVPRGQVTVCYSGMPLGYVKNLGSRANNLYPKEWRIRNL